MSGGSHRHYSLLFVAVVALLVASVVASIEIGVMHARNGKQSGPPGGPKSTQGPLASATDDFSGVSESLDPNKPISIGLFLPKYTGSTPAVLESLAPIRRASGMTILGSSILTQVENTHSLTSAYQYPPDGYTVHPLNGFAYAASDGKVEIVVGLQVSSGGVFSLHGFTLAYHVGAKHYVATYARLVTICSPVSKYPSCTVLPTG
jgi:hypothetical protein